MDWFTSEQVDAYRGHAFVELALKPEKTPGGIIRVPDARMQMTDNKFATVLSVHSSFTEDTGVKEGDMVLLGRYTGHVWAGKRRFFVDESAILAIYEGDEFVS